LQEAAVPEVFFRIRWPDKTVDRCYSPSTVLEDYFAVGDTYPVTEFVDRSRQALTAASEQVRNIYRYGCSQAAAQLADIERVAARFTAQGATVTVEGFER
jgi:uncharacterized repeat protein (TIGR04042 family)